MSTKRKIEDEETEATKKAKPTNDDEKEEEDEEFSCTKCKSTFTTQLELGSHMTNVNCKPIMTPKCLLCDIGKKHALKKYDTIL